MKKLTKRQQAEKLVRSMEAIAAECEEIFGAPLANWGLCPQNAIRAAKHLLATEKTITLYIVAHLLEERNQVARAGNYVASESDINPLYDDEWKTV